MIAAGSMTGARVGCKILTSDAPSVVVVPRGVVDREGDGFGVVVRDLGLGGIERTDGGRVRADGGVGAPAAVVGAVGTAIVIAGGRLKPTAPIVVVVGVGAVDGAASGSTTLISVPVTVESAGVGTPRWTGDDMSGGEPAASGVAVTIGTGFDELMAAALALVVVVVSTVSSITVVVVVTKPRSELMALGCTGGADVRLSGSGGGGGESLVGGECTV